MKAYILLYTLSQDKIWRSYTVDGETCLSAAKDASKAHPRLIVGLFENKDGDGGEAMFFFPEDVLLPGRK